jgi:eukaryotic-like serine/threonine-protein kinase
MTAERWQRLTQIVNDCLELPADTRDAHARELCAGDEALHREAMQWINDAEQTQGFLDEAAGIEVLTLHPSADDITRRAESALQWTGKRLGPYRVTEEIARGGMGSVFKAVRADRAYEQIVAIKIVRSHVATELIAQRFRAERQILANLEHPHIARLIDGGQSDDGTPYLVMEYIDGKPIDDYCESRGLSVNERLKLFRDVCSAVQYAHQRLIVHRDLKPSNILVDTTGQVKLLDFGIAKLLDSAQLDEHGNAVAPPTEANAMTPAYASPEQVKGEAITTASDVYALGVLLYRLLTGRSPYKASTTQALALAKEIVETDPERPSTVVTQPESTRPTERTVDTNEIKKNIRTLDSKRLQKELRGDLDNVVLMALRKDPQRRYTSAEQMAEDLRRCQGNLPVIARADTFSYRARKFVLRNRWSVALAALSAMVLIGGIIATAHQAREARIAQARAEKLFKGSRGFANKIQVEGLSIISDIPGTAEAQKFVLDTSLTYQKELASDIGNDRQLTLEIAGGFVNLATTQERALVAVPLRRETLLSAQELVERAEQLAPRDAASLRMLIPIKTRLAVLDSEQQKWSPAKVLFEEAIALARIKTSREDAFPLVSARAEAVTEYGRAAGVENSFDRRIALLTEARALIESLDRTKLKEDEKYDADIQLASVLGYLANMENDRPDLAGVDASIAYGARAVALLEERYKQTPNNLRVLGNLNFSAGLLADQYGKKRDFSAARIYFKKARDYAEPLIRRDPTQSMLTINMLAVHLTEIEMELRAGTELIDLLVVLADVDRRVKALPESVRQERVGIALRCWVNGLHAEAKFRRAVQLNLPLDTRRTLLRASMALFVDSAATLEKITEMIDQSSPEIIELVRSGEQRSRAALAALEKR